jgi:hypothetical protein
MRCSWENQVSVYVSLIMHFNDDFFHWENKASVYISLIMHFNDHFFHYSPDWVVCNYSLQSEHSHVIHWGSYENAFFHNLFIALRSCLSFWAIDVNTKWRFISIIEIKHIVLPEEKKRMNEYKIYFFSSNKCKCLLLQRIIM